MAQFRVKPRVLETSLITGSGTYTLLGAATGFQAFLGGGVSAGDLMPYYATDGTNWEEGIGTVGSGPATLARTHIHKSSIADAAIAWGANTTVEIRCGWVSQLTVPRVKSVSIAGGAGTQILTQDEQRCDILILTGALTGNRNIEVDATPWKWAAVRNDTTGAFTATLRVTGQTGILVGQGRAKVLYNDGTDVRDPDASFDEAVGYTLINGTLVHTRASNAETIAVKTLAGADPSAADPVRVVFRDQAATTGGYVVRTITAALSLTISSGSTLGFTSSVPGRIWSVIFDDAGTLRLGVINCIATSANGGTGRNVTAIYPLSAGVASSTAEGGAGAADSALTFYTGTAVSAKPYAVIGYSTWESGLATAGTWGTAPSKIQLYAPGVELPGTPIQRQITQDSAVASGTTNLPGDDTIPQNTEGTQFQTVTITPTSAANPVEIASVAQLQHGSNATTGWALFQDSTANSFAAGYFYPASTAQGGYITSFLSAMLLAQSTSAITYKLRAGGTSGGTTTFNGSAGGRLYGGVSGSIMKATEIMG
jgi:hypothetical protein